MKSSVLSLGLAAATTSTAFMATPVTADALSDCLGRLGGAMEHSITLVEAGFFPTTTYVCPGDIVTFENSHWWAQFRIDFGSTEYFSGWVAPYASHPSMEFTVDATMTDVEFYSLKSHPYYPSAYRGYISLGIAPYDMDDL
ncbi:hypothetical protein AB3Y40_12260 [Yoonia sp. R2331]|uniref:hypothetical protein n=1 Tax=Yoonia sp. R2331 TaxID=3237238 RepID=UPI0034E4DC2B